MLPIPSCCGTRGAQMVAEVRHGDKGPLGGAHPAIQPERVIHHNKRVRLRWARLGVQLQGARQEGLDDVMLLDLSFLTRHMQAPLESHARWSLAPLAPSAPASRMCIWATFCGLLIHVTGGFPVG